MYKQTRRGGESSRRVPSTRRQGVGSPNSPRSERACITGRAQLTARDLSRPSRSPLPCPHHSDVALSLSAGTRALGTTTSSRAPRTMWTDDEITTLLALVNEKKLSDLLDSKRQKNKDIFMDLERCLKEQGLTWTWEQIRTCWKNLKKRFTAERLLLCKSGGEWKMVTSHPFRCLEFYLVSTASWRDQPGVNRGRCVRLRIRLRRALCRNRTTAAIALCSVSQDANTTIKYSWCKLRKNTKTASRWRSDNCVNNRSPQRREARAQVWRSGNRYRKTGFRLASTQSVAAITAHLNSSVRVHINSGASSVSQDTNTTIKYSWCKLRKNTKTAIAVAERQLRKQPQPTAARAQAWRSGNRYRKTGFRLASTPSVAAITAHLNSSVRVHINSGTSR
ncbi:hypothetical protein HPB51_015697 [Rhipicephalus microplus]|uniref:Myb/SANT-like DNA-binding domain-containing protein n=1 Tax=Rhipicephalus microplus TaxID=6941 RepID=A0A9J6D5B4_RHIMP|nr:hypothetical protein HPB51_015697 [Rhipicephalus microplus]